MAPAQCPHAIPRCSHGSGRPRCLAAALTNYIHSMYAPANARPSLLCGRVRSGSSAGGRQAATWPPRRTLIDALAGAIGNSIPSDIAGGVFRERIFIFLPCLGYSECPAGPGVGDLDDWTSSDAPFSRRSDTRLGGERAYPSAGACWERVEPGAWHRSAVRVPACFCHPSRGYIEQVPRTSA